MRRRLFEIIEKGKPGDTVSNAYDIFMTLTILISILPMAFTEVKSYFMYIDHVCGIIFIIDYIMRLATADIKLEEGRKSFVKYPFTPMALIDLISIIPSFVTFTGVWRLSKLMRLTRAVRVLRLLRLLRYFDSVQIMVDVFKRQKEHLVVVYFSALIYVNIVALVMLNVEPETFHNYFRAAYWATVTLSTVGYGDICPTTALGQFFTVVTNLVGMAIIAMPAGIITAGFMEEFQERKDAQKNTDDDQEE